MTRSVRGRFSIASRSALSEKKSLTVGIPLPIAMSAISAQGSILDLHAERGEFESRVPSLEPMSMTPELGEADFLETVPPVRPSARCRSG